MTLLGERLSSQLLAGDRPRDPVAVAERLLAVQAQDGRAARLAVRARTEGVSAADVDKALTEDRSLLITWLNRGTLHLVRAEDYPWLQLLTTPPLASANARRLAQEGVTAAAAERGVAVIVRALTDEGPLTRAQIGERLTAAGIRTAGQAIVHILLLASLRGHIVRGPMVGRQHAFGLARDWLGALPVPDRDAALAELARRYLAGHQPVDDRDLARWAGLPLRDARAGLRAIASECTERPDGLLELKRRSGGWEPVPAREPVLLGGWEPVLLGWCSREFLVGPHADALISGGLFKPFALVAGTAVASWRLINGHVELEPLQRIAAADLAALAADGEAVRAYLAL